MNSARLKTIASLINQDDIVLDVGCDHGYLDIYLVKNNICKKVYASDISPKALAGAKKNFQKYAVLIPTFLSDGLQNITVDFNTLVLAGMGTSTILKILDYQELPAKLILASNNEYAKLRRSINKLGYKITTEKVVLEKGHYYVILVCLKGKQKLSKKEILYGLSNDQEYFKYLKSKTNELIKKVPFKKKWQLKYASWQLKGLIEKK